MADRLALITGVSRPEGLGFAVAAQLAERNYEVVISARELSRADELAARLRARGLAVTAQQLDVIDAASIEACVGELEHRSGRLDALINNAAGGFDIDQTVLDADLERARLALEVNFLGPWRLTQALLPLLRRSDAGRIVNVTSEAGSLTSPQGLTNPAIGGLIPGYALSKSALNALTLKLARALDSTRILVNAVCPGHTATHPELGDEDDARPASQSARGVVWAATLPPGGPTGGLYRDGQPLPW